MRKNHAEYKEKFLSQFNLGDMLRLSDTITALCGLIPEPNEIADDALELQQEVDRKLALFQTGHDCPRCGGSLYLSDLPQYDEICYDCDENF